MAAITEGSDSSAVASSVAPSLLEVLDSSLAELEESSVPESPPQAETPTPTVSTRAAAPSRRESVWTRMGAPVWCVLGWGVLPASYPMVPHRNDRSGPIPADRDRIETHDGPATREGRPGRRGVRGSGLGGLVLGRDVLDAVGVHLDAGAHRRRDGDLLDVAALGAGRLETQHLVEGGGVVLRALDLGEGRLADDEVQVRVAVDAELDLAALDVRDGLGDVGGHRAGLRVRHERARAEDATEATDLDHHVGGGDDGVEVEPAAGDLLDQLVATDVVGAGLTGGLGLVGVREHQDAGGLAGAVRQVDGAAHHLVRLAGVDAETHDDVHGLVELLLAGALRDLDRGQRGVELVLVERVRRRAVGLAALHGVPLLAGAVVSEPA